MRSKGSSESAACAWCAIEIGSKVDVPFDNTRVYDPLFGWREDRGWAAFPIKKVRLFKQVKVSQWCQGRPFALSVCAETTELEMRYINNIC